MLEPTSNPQVTSDMGAKIAELTPPRDTVLDRLFVGLMASVFLCGGVAGVASSNPGLQFVGILILIIGAAMLVAIILTTWRKGMRPGQNIQVYQGGLVISGRARRQVVVRWTDIVDFVDDGVQTVVIGFHWVTARTSHTFLFHRLDGSVVSFKCDDINTSAVVQIVWRNVLRQLGPPLFKRYQDGAMLEFGKVRLNSKNIIVDTQTLHWDQLAMFSIQGGKLVFQTRMSDHLLRDWVRVRVDETVNLPILVEIIRRTIGSEKVSPHFELARSKVRFGI